MRNLLNLFLIMAGILFVIIMTPIALVVLWIGKNLFLGLLSLFIVALVILELWKLFTGDTTSFFDMFNDHND